MAQLEMHVTIDTSAVMDALKEIKDRGVDFDFENLADATEIEMETTAAGETIAHVVPSPKLKALLES